MKTKNKIISDWVVSKRTSGQADKQSWEMTKDEFNSLLSEKTRSVFGDHTHKNLVIEALASGKSVPQIVLNDYPGIVELGKQAKDNSDKYDFEKSARDATAIKAVKEKEQKEYQDMIRLKQKQHDALITTPLKILIARSGYKTNRRGVHDLIKYDQSEAIKKALSESKPVPAEVLKDYPELQAEPEAAEKEPWEMKDCVY